MSKQITGHERVNRLLRKHGNKQATALVYLPFTHDSYENFRLECKQINQRYDTKHDQLRDYYNSYVIPNMTLYMDVEGHVTGLMASISGDTEAMLEGSLREIVEIIFRFYDMNSEDEIADALEQAIENKGIGVHMKRVILSVD